MAELILLDRAVARLSGAGLVPAPTSLGVAEPAVAGDLPALVLSLVDARRGGGGLGGRTRVVDDAALPWREVILLEAAVLPGSPPLDLWDAPTRTLSLPHGGLVRRDLSMGPLTAADFLLTVDGTPWALGDGSPGQSVQVDPATGRIVFAQDPGATATVAVDYHLGRWEQQVVRMTGVLRVDVIAASVDDVRALSRAALDVLADRPAIAGLLYLDVQALGSVGAPEAGHGGRRRTIDCNVEFEVLLNRPPSAGGIIRRIPLATRLVSAAVDATGAVVESMTTEAGGGLPLGARE